ncbi:hypothetical protein D3C77_97860 [compost metagenome]
MLPAEIIQCLSEVTGLTVAELPAVLHYGNAAEPAHEIHIESDQELITLWCALPCPEGVAIGETLLRINSGWRDPSASWLYYDPRRHAPVLISTFTRSMTSPAQFCTSAELFFKACDTMRTLLADRVRH